MAFRYAVEVWRFQNVLRSHHWFEVRFRKAYGVLYFSWRISVDA